MSTPTVEAGQYTNITATAALTTQPANLIGFYVNSTSGGTVVIRDGGSGGTVVSGTITPAVGFHRFPAACPAGIHVTIAVAAINITLFWSQA